MAREAWPKPEVIEASKDVVCLAVYRWGERAGDTPGGKDAKSSSPTDSAWAVRLDVMGYPQIRLLDGWGRPLPSAVKRAYARNAADVVETMHTARDEGARAAKSSAKAVAPAFPAAVLAKLTADEKKLAASPIDATRARAWLASLGRGAWERPLLHSLWKDEPDAVVRVAVAEALARLPSDAASIDVLADGVGGDHDYVRRACLTALGKLGGKEAAAAVAAVVTKALPGGAPSSFRNPNNVLCDALGVCETLADPSHVDVLGRVVALRQGNNYATVLAVRSLAAIATKKGADVAAIRKHFDVARAIEGPLAAQIRRIVEDATSSR